MRGGEVVWNSKGEERMTIEWMATERRWVEACGGEVKKDGVRLGTITTQ